MNETFYFENTTNNHSKFWAITVRCNLSPISKWELIRRYGKIGDSGRIMTEIFSSYGDALNKRDKLIEEKLSKGYKAVL